ncbi:MAG: O-antigen ligase family protein [Chloroflexi bacterium]|nr:O-antigen ligase family protein [Chloroflexota bacterium]
MSDLTKTTLSDSPQDRPTWFIWPLSRPLTDVQLTLILLPFLWIFGLEQIIPIVLIAWAFIKLILVRKRIIVPITAFLFISFIIWVFASSLSVSGGSDWIVFGRNITMYVLGLFILLIIVNDTQNGRDINKTVAAILLLSSMITLIAVLFMVGILPAKFEAILIHSILPGSLQQSQFVQDNILLREIGRPNAMLGIHSLSTCKRHLFVFKYSIPGLHYFYGMGWIFHYSDKKQKRWLLIGLLIVQMIVLLFIASRVAIVAFITAVGCLTLLRMQHKLRLPFIIIPVLITFFILFAALIALLPSNFLTEFINETFFSLRADSFSSRMEVYKATIDLWLSKPFTGWGTPRKIETVELAPAGTHGDYLATLFRYGLVGFVFYGAMLSAIWVQIIRQLHTVNKLSVINKKARNFHNTTFVIFLALTICGLAYGFYFDLSFVILNWTVIGLIHVKSSTIITS